jgi:hypothetical protein
MLEKIKGIIVKPLVAGILGFVLGLIIGLPILGWGLIPVKWVDASAAQLRADVKKDYLRMAIESYAKNPDPQKAGERWSELGSSADAVLAELQADNSENPQDIAGFIAAAKITNVSPASGAPVQTDQSVTQTPAGSAAKKPSLNLVVLLIVFLVLTVIIGGTLVYLLFIRKRSAQSSDEETVLPQAEEEGEAPKGKTDYAAEGQELPIAQYITTYSLGNDLYDDSFSIDSATGEFLGECGVGVSEHIGVGDPKKVTALEVWLFDKNDIQTITKVLMSEYAFNNPEISQKLVSKGEPVVVEPGKHILLETATLQLEARIVDMSYGQGALPPNSFFERLILELAIWTKPAA